MKRIMLSIQFILVQNLRKLNNNNRLSRPRHPEIHLDTCNGYIENDWTDLRKAASALISCVFPTSHVSPRVLKQCDCGVHVHFL